MYISQISEILLLNGIEDFIINIDREKQGIVTIKTDSDHYRISDLLEPYRPIGVQFIYMNKSCICFGPPRKDCPKHGDSVI
jgi:hypothetical protein